MNAPLNIPMEHGLLLASARFALGFVGLIVRRNILFMLVLIRSAPLQRPLVFGPVTRPVVAATGSPA